MRISARMKTLYAIGFVLTLAGGLAGCEQDGPAEQAGERVDRSVEKAGESMERAGDRAQDRLER